MLLLQLLRTYVIWKIAYLFLPVELAEYLSSLVSNLMSIQSNYHMGFSVIGFSSGGVAYMKLIWSDITDANWLFVWEMTGPG